MKLYRVYGHTSVNVIVEVEANSEKEAFEAAYAQRSCLDSYAGNGGTDMIVGVDGDNECVAADENITYDDIEVIEED